MNLAFDPWIPCLRRDGTFCLASLCQCLTDSDIVDLAVRPHERVALMRLLLCVAYAAVGIPRDYTEWKGCRERLPGAVPPYLEQWRDSFALFHPQKPFLQVAGLKSAAKPGKKKEVDAGEGGDDGPTSTAKLDFALASGNNSTLFDHEARNPRRAASPEKLALDLLTFQMFSPGGLIGSIVWQGQERSRTSSDAPCIPGSMLHTFVRGADLPETVWRNLLAADRLHAFASLGDGWQGRPLWERFPQGPQDVDAVHNATRTFLGRMVPLSRAVRLQADGVSMLLGNGLDYPSFSNAKNPFPEEPSATVVLRKGKKDASERALLGVQPGKAIWRQLHALVVQRDAEGVGCCPALARVNAVVDKAVDIVVAGVARDQANIIDVVESVFHVPAPLLREDGHDLYAEEVRLAEETEQYALASAVERWRVSVDGGWQARLKLAGGKKYTECAKLRAQASRDYWTAVEGNLSLLWEVVAALDTDASADKQRRWHELLRDSALNAYTTACRGSGERQLRAFVAGRRELFRKMYKILELPQKEDK